MSARRSSLRENDDKERRHASASLAKSSNESDSKRKAEAAADGDSHKSRKRPVDCRRSTAAQFFAEEETAVVQQVAPNPEQVVKLLSEATSSKDSKCILNNLQAIKEIIIDREPKLLDNFLDEVISFQADPSITVRKFIIQFIEDICKHEIQNLPKVVGNLIMFLNDKSVIIHKKVIQTTCQLYPLAIKWFCKAKTINEIMQATWTSMTGLKNEIFDLLETDNEGLKALVVKFMEVVILSQTFRDQNSPNSLSLDDIPVILKVFRPRKLEEEAKDMFQRIVDFHGATHVSSFNLIVCMQALTNVGRKRFEFFPKVLQAFESLHVNLPPTLSQSQVSSVRKNLKLQLFMLVKHPFAVEFQSRISIMLSDLGATPQQINKLFPLTKKSHSKQSSKADKKPSYKIDKDDDDEDDDEKPEVVLHIPPPVTVREKQVKAKDTAIDITAEDLLPKFTTVNVADLALICMLSLPDIMPAHFQSTYTPIAAAGKDPQKKHLSRLLATQLTIAGLGKGVEEMKQSIEEESDSSEDEEETYAKQIKTVVGKVVDLKPEKQAVVLMPSGVTLNKSSKFSKSLDFQSIVKPYSTDESDKLARSAYNRILNAEKSIHKRGGTAMRTKILTTLATQFDGDFSIDLRDHILENPRTRTDLAFSWIFQEYSAHRGFESSVENPIQYYEATINQLLKGILEGHEQNHALWARFFIDSPYVTDSLAEFLKIVCNDSASTELGLNIAKNLALRRPTKKLLFLGIIADLTLHENFDIRTKSVNTTVELHESGVMTSFIEAFALRSLKYLLLDIPTSNIVFVSHPSNTWTEELVKVCLHLYLSLLPVNHKLIHDLGTVYVETSPDIKRMILRALEAPVKGMSMSSPELLRFVEKCPKGAETLVTRIIHILTDKAPPSGELVNRVRDLYRKRVPDVRFLIPIITGLTKREVILALPELIKLNPTVVKEVFHRLLGSNFPSPLSPAELLVALHNVDTAKCNLKTIIKATSLCFEEKSVYTQVVLGMVMQQLMEQNPLPILLMRTVIQSLAIYPPLLGFVTNVLQRLIMKQVWKQKKIWEGFIKCCQRTKPQSFQVLLQLPPPQLQEVLQSCPDLRNPLIEHVDSFTDHQKGHIPQTIMDVLISFKPAPPPLQLHIIEGIDEKTGEPLPPGQDHV